MLLRRGEGGRGGGGVRRWHPALNKRRRIGNVHPYLLVPHASAIVSECVHSLPGGVYAPYNLKQAHHLPTGSLSLSLLAMHLTRWHTLPSSTSTPLPAALKAEGPGIGTLQWASCALCRGDVQRYAPLCLFARQSVPHSHLPTSRPAHACFPRPAAYSMHAHLHACTAVWRHCTH